MLHDIVNDPNVQATIQALVLALATAGAGVITVAINRFVRANVSVRNLDLLDQAARMAVLYAEQTGLAKSGAEKLATAMSAADDILAAHGVHVTLEQLRVAIEAAVKEHLHPATEPTTTLISIPKSLGAPTISAGPVPAAGAPAK